MTTLLDRRTHRLAKPHLEQRDPPPPPRARAGRWRSRHVRALATATIAAASGGLSALAMPRGAVTTAQALAVMALGIGVGLIAGVILRSRWAMVIPPIAHVGVFELARIGVDGPLVDAPKLDTSYGILAFLLGRGFQGVLVVGPMLVGAAYGAALARRSRAVSAHGRRRVMRWLRGAVTAVAALALLILAAFIARPASVPPVVGADGEPLPGSVATLEKVEINGHTNWLTIRGHSDDLPVLLFLSGGPGQTDLPQTRVLWRDLEDDFLVVNWDERGTGKAYAELDPTVTLTIASIVDDTIAVTNYLRERFDEEKIYIVGESWGTMLGVLAVQRAPELFHAYIGSGQMVDVEETDRLLYDDMLAYAERTGDDGAARKMRDYGPPPYADPFANGYVMGYYERLAGDYEVPQYVQDRYEEDPYGPWGVYGSEYSLVDKVNVLRGLIDYFAVVYPQIQRIDLRQDVTRLDVPVYVVQGRHELRARTDLVPEWLASLSAPSKELVWFEDASHATAFEDFRRFERLMTGTVLPDTYGAAGREGSER